MTATTTPLETFPAATAEPTAHRDHGLRDVWVIAKRGVVHMKRQPEVLTDATIQPVMFVLLFAYVFGGAIPIPGGGSYREFLMGGIFAQTIVFTAFGVAMGIATDRKNGAVDRFRSLPIARGSFLGGHALANLIKTILPIVLMSLCGLAVGWRIHDGFVHATIGYALMIAFAFSMVWLGILLGSVVSTPEAVQGVAFTGLFPLTFIASTFVPLRAMPGWLRTVAQWNPVTTLSDALRVHFGNPNPLAVKGAQPWPLAHPTEYTLLWIVGLIALCAPLAIRSYQRSLGG